MNDLIFQYESLDNPSVKGKVGILWRDSKYVLIYETDKGPSKDMLKFCTIEGVISLIRWKCISVLNGNYKYAIEHTKFKGKLDNRNIDETSFTSMTEDLVTALKIVTELTIVKNSAV